MRYTIDRLLRGQFEYEDRTLTCAIDRLDIALWEGESPEGSFDITGTPGYPLEGEASTTEPRLTLLTPSFSGTQSEIAWRFDGRGLAVGDVTEGTIRIISNSGELSVPYRAVVQKRRPDSSMGEIANLFHFANLAKANWEEAQALFYSPDFPGMFSESDHADETLYRGLSHTAGSAQGMEEFLLSVHKKSPVSYHCDPPQVLIDYSMGQNRYELRIVRNGWGYTEVMVEVDGAFLQVDATKLLEADFVGNFCLLRLFIDPEKLHAGRNFGRVILRHPYGETVVPVTVTDSLELPAGHTARHKSGDVLLQYELKLMRLYEDFRCKRIGSRAWLSEIGKLVTAMEAAVPGESPVVRAYTAQYLITAGRGSEARYILNQLGAQFESGELEDETLRAYYLYLTSLLSRDDTLTGEVAEKIGRIYGQDESDFRVAWICQYVSETLTEDPRAKYRFLTNQVRQGCRSPLIYLEAVLLLSESPDLLVRLTDTEMILLHYGVRKGLISEGLAEQAISLGRRERNYSLQLFRIMVGCYQVCHTEEALDAVCGLLIKGGRTDEEAHRWYALAVDKQLRITRLYEYYMMSIAVNEDGVLPEEISKQVLMYFSYQSDLDYDKNAILYRYLHEHRETYPELWNSYRNQIDRYLMEQLDHGRVNDDLAYLYQNMLTRQMVDMENSTQVLAILNTWEFISEDPAMDRVYIIYDRLTQEIEIRLNEGRACFPLYGSDFRILQQDAAGHRYAEGRKFTLRRMILAPQIEGFATPYIRRGRGNLDLFLSELGKGAYTISLDNVDRFRDLANSGLVQPACRAQIRRNLIRFYYDNDFTAQLMDYLNELDPVQMSGEERREVVSMLILIGEEKRALELLRTGGFYGVEEKLVLRLVDALLSAGELPVDELCLQLAWYAFAGRKYDEQVLKYLVAHFSGTSRELYRLFAAAVSFGVEVHGLCARLLEQALTTGALPNERAEVYQQYAKEGGGGDVERAYLARAAHDDFSAGVKAEDFVYEQIGRLLMRGQKEDVLPQICGIAWLDHYAARVSELSDSQQALAARLLRGLLLQEHVYPFYHAYEALLPEQELTLPVMGHAVLSYRARQGSEVYAHTRREDMPDAEFTVTRMRETMEGVFVASFLLFGGETLDYYITVEECEGRLERLVESGSLTGRGAGEEHAGRLSYLDELHTLVAHRHEEQAECLLDQYMRERFLCDRLFQPMSMTGGKR